MTDTMRRKIALYFRELLDDGMHKKVAFLMVENKHQASRRSIYRYCGKFGVSTK